MQANKQKKRFAFLKTSLLHEIVLLSGWSYDTLFQLCSIRSKKLVRLRRYFKRFEKYCKIRNLSFDTYFECLERSLHTAELLLENLEPKTFVNILKCMNEYLGFRSMTSLRFDNVPISSSTNRLLASLLSRFERLKILEISSSGVDYEFMLNLVKGLSTHASEIEELYLKSNGCLSTSGFKLINKATFPNLQKLTFSTFSKTLDNIYFDFPKLTLLDAEFSASIDGKGSNLPNLQTLIFRSDTLCPKTLISNFKCFNLKELYLRSNSLDNESIEALVSLDLPMLQLVDLSYNKIDTYGARYFLNNSKLRQLQSINLSYNNIHGDGREILDLTTLQDVNLSYNSIGGLLEYSMTKLNYPLLKSLIVSGIGINKGFSNISERSFPNLKTLDISSNCGVPIEYLAKAQMPLLESLNLSSIILNKEGMKSLSECRFSFLNELVLSDNFFNPAEFNYFTRFYVPKVQKLYLDGCVLGNVGMKLLVKTDLQSLKVLFLSRNQLGNEGLSYLSKMSLPNLRDLNLSSNNIEDKGCEDIVNSFTSSLFSLNLRRNLITTISFTEKKQYRLKDLNLSSNSISTVGSMVKALQNSLLLFLRNLDLSSNRLATDESKVLEATCLHSRIKLSL